MASVTSATPIPSTVQVRASSRPRITFAYFVLVLNVQFASLVLTPFIGLALNALLLAALFFLGTHARVQNQRRVLLAFALVPLIRLVTLSLPLTVYPTLYWPLLTGLPLCLAIYFVLWSTSLSLADVGFRGGSWRLQLTVAPSGIVLA